MGVTARSRFTGEPSFKLPSVDRKSVSFETSAVKESGFTSSAVRHTPLTEIESPSCDPSVTVRASMTMRASSPRFSIARMRPSSSMIPVNIVWSRRHPACGPRASVPAKLALESAQEDENQSDDDAERRDAQRKNHEPPGFILECKCK